LHVDEARLAVIPAKAGIHFDFCRAASKRKWIPAFAGMTGVCGVVGMKWRGSSGARVEQRPHPDAIKGRT
jgi:hypothetical protein